MALFGNPSIRSVLGAIIGVLGLFLVGELSTGLFGAVERNSAAQKAELAASREAGTRIRSLYKRSFITNGCGSRPAEGLSYWGR